MHTLKSLFEHMQQVSGKVRSTKTHNRAEGDQIVEDLQYMWINSSPALMKACEEAERERIENGGNIRKRKFSVAFLDEIGDDFEN